MPIRVFISYAFEDREFVASELIPLLKSHTIDTWYAEGEVRSAQRWEREILSALRSCDWFIVVMSEHSLNSEWVKNEVNWAMQNRIGMVVPVKLRECVAEEFHLGLPRIQFVDYQKDREIARQELLASFVTKQGGNPTAPVVHFDSSANISRGVREPRTPFHCGQWVPPDFFVGREAELTRARQLIAARQNFIVTGTPRSGKTSFFRKLIYELNTATTRKNLSSYVNLEQGVQLNVRSFMEHTLLCIFGEMAREVFGCRYSDLLQNEIGGALSHLAKDADFAQFRKIFSLVTNYTHSDKERRNQTFVIHEFVRFVNELLEICVTKGFGSFTMFYDEANRLPKDISVELLNNLGEALSQTGLIGAYVAGPQMGSHFVDLPGLASNQIRIGAFQSDVEMRNLLIQYYFDYSERSDRLPIADSAVQRIWEVSEGKPYLIQLLASGAFGEAARDDAIEVDDNHVRRAYSIVNTERPEAFQ